jgi:hypothetical protein
MKRFTNEMQENRYGEYILYEYHESLVEELEQRISDLENELKEQKELYEANHG